MATVSVRYIVRDVDAAIGFYRDKLGFTLAMHPAPAFAMLARGDLRLLWFALQHRNRPLWLWPAAAVLGVYALDPVNFTLPVPPA